MQSSTPITIDPCGISTPDEITYWRPNLHATIVAHVRADSTGVKSASAPRAPSEAYRSLIFEQRN